MVKSLRIQGDVGIYPELADGVKFVESVDARSACHTVPIVAASFAPAVNPGLAYRR